MTVTWIVELEMGGARASYCLGRPYEAVREILRRTSLFRRAGRQGRAGWRRSPRPGCRNRRREGRLHRDPQERWDFVASVRVASTATELVVMSQRPSVPATLGVKRASPNTIHAGVAIAPGVRGDVMMRPGVRRLIMPGMSAAAQFMIPRVFTPIAWLQTSGPVSWNGQPGPA